MKRFFEIIALILLTGIGLAAIYAGTMAESAQGAFGFNPGQTGASFRDEDGAPAMQAGSHPFEFVTKIGMNTTLIPEGGGCKAPQCELPEGEIEDLTVELPPGFTGNPFAIPRCSNVDFITRVNSQPSCPDSSALGLTAIQIEFSPLPAGEDKYIHVPVYNLEPPPGVAAKLGFAVLNVPVTVEATVNPSPPYKIEAHATNIAQVTHFYRSALSLWGNPAAAVHDSFRGKCLEPVLASALEDPISLGKCSAGTKERAFLTVPRRCEGPLETDFGAVAWNTGAIASLATITEDEDGNPLETVECAGVPFSAPEFKATPTSRAAESPSGLDVELDIEDEGLLNPDGRARSDIKKVAVTLPKGVTVNPSQAEGLAVCSEAAFEAEKKLETPFGSGCPAASKIGTVEVETPILEEEVLKGSVFVAAPGQNPFKTLLALYMVIKHPERGISIGTAGKVEPDPKTGQLLTTFDDLPQQPLSHVRFHLREGARSPLVMPPLCGPHTTEATFYPWSKPATPFVTTSEFEIVTGPGGGPCPSGGAPPFHPGLEAGSLNNAAGAFSPFTMRLTRQDGEQNLTRLSAVLPPGISGKIAGVAKCSDAAIAAAETKTGLEELASPSCPENSQVGRTLAGAGAGSALTFVVGKLYLAGPFGGDPLSVVSITPAVAGPFDVGVVVVRFALQLNPDTAEVEVDGAASDPIPHILAGIPLKLRDLRAFTDRPSFTINPTGCKRTATKATVFGDFLDLFNPADDVSVSLASRYQAAGCAALPFKPKLSVRLKGGTKRGAHPALRAVFAPRAGDANTGKLRLTFPHSAFLEQSHIRTVCTRVQFAVSQCPSGSVYGRVKAFSPLLDEPLSGKVHLRSSSNPLPDLVLALRGIVDFNGVVRVDSVNARIRTTVDFVPDVPVSKVVVDMQGGKKGLIVNSRNLCAHKSKARVEFTGHNGKRFETKPVVRASCGTPKR